MATLTESIAFAQQIKNQVHTIENISEEVFKYEMEISHLHENSEYYIINYNKIYTKQGYNYILKNVDGNFYWSNHYINNFIETSKFPLYFKIKTHEFHNLINQYGNIYLDDSQNPIIELEVECAKVDMTEIYKPNIVKATKGSSNKVVDDYYVSRYIYGLKYTTKVVTQGQNLKNEKQDKEETKEQSFKEFEYPQIVPSYDIKNRLITIKEKLKSDLSDVKDIRNKLDGYKDTISKLSEIKEILEK